MRLALTSAPARVFLCGVSLPRPGLSRGDPGCRGQRVAGCGERQRRAAGKPSAQVQRRVHAQVAEHGPGAVPVTQFVVPEPEDFVSLELQVPIASHGRRVLRAVGFCSTVAGVVLFSVDTVLSVSSSKSAPG